MDGVTGTFQQGYSSSNCVEFLDMSSTEDVTDWSFHGACTSSCTQRTDGVCDGAFLEQVVVGPSIKYAFCNDKWLLVMASGEGDARGGAAQGCESLNFQGSVSSAQFPTQFQSSYLGTSDHLSPRSRTVKKKKF